MLKLNRPYQEVLQDSEPVYVSLHPNSFGFFSASKTTENDLLIPPLNTDISFSSIPSQNPKTFLKATKPLPENWNWKHTFPDDSEDVLRKKENISGSGNQMRCGSCWSISTASIISDLFVASGITSKNPSISTTYSLACYPQAKCLGGNPALLFQDIANGGITDNTCVDYSWCAENANCNGSALQHFDVKNLNTLVPSCGCYNAGPHYRYKISNLAHVGIALDDSNENALSDMIEHVKQHIYTVGPVLGGFLVFDNFMSGAFTKSNNGVYFESADYSTPGQVRFGHTPNFKGSHAIAILGWGIAKNTKTPNGVEDVPYWFCRNSWTEKWGESGCFKMAMYPYNKLSQFEKIVIISAPDGEHQGGGILTCRPTGAPVAESMNENNYNGKMESPASFYSTLPDLFSKTLVSGGKKSKNVFMISIGVVIVVLILLFLLKK